MRSTLRSIELDAAAIQLHWTSMGKNSQSVTSLILRMPDARRFQVKATSALAPAGTAGRWLAREAPDVVTPHGPSRALRRNRRSCRLADVRPLLGSRRLVNVCGYDRQLRGAEIGTANVYLGSRCRALHSGSYAQIATMHR